MNNLFDLNRITAETFVERVHFFDAIDSTNTVALQSTDTAGDGAELFLAERQTSGRGRGANQWWSAEGSLTFSLLAPSLSIVEKRLPQVALATGVAICQAVERFAPAPEVRLKWPNDVFLDGKKVSGILIESTASKPRRLVIGVGLNVNNSLDGAPDEIIESATSLQQHSSRTSRQTLDRTAVLIYCLMRIEQRLHQLAANGDSLPGLWCCYSLLTGKQVRIETPQGELAGLCKGIANDGALLIETEGEVVPCYTGVITEFR